MCVYGHVPMQDQPAVINLSCWWTTVTNVAGHEGSRYNNDQYAIGIYMGIAGDGKLADSSPLGVRLPIFVSK